MWELIHQSEAPDGNGNIIRCTSYSSGKMRIQPLGFGFYHVKWWGSCNPLKDGYTKILYNIYWKKDK